MGIFGFFSKEKKESLNSGLAKTKESVFKKLSRAVVGKSKVDDEVLDNLEDALITSDVGVATTVKIIERLQDRVAVDKYLNTSELNKILKEVVISLLNENTENNFSDSITTSDGSPYVIMVVGVNGAGKTTTIGKLAHQFKAAGKKVYLGAADTFRAAAIEQLEVWAQRVDVPIVKQAMGADPASVAFDTLNSAVANKADVVIIDTAGRLHNKVNLMNELSKKNLIHLDALTVTGTMGDRIKNTPVEDNTVIHSVESPYRPEGGIAVLKGNLAPDYAVVKASAVAEDMLTYTGKAKCYNSEPEACDAIMNGEIHDGDVVVIRYEGPKGGSAWY